MATCFLCNALLIAKSTGTFQRARKKFNPFKPPVGRPLLLLVRLRNLSLLPTSTTTTTTSSASPQSRLRLDRPIWTGLPSSRLLVCCSYHRTIATLPHLIWSSIVQPFLRTEKPPLLLRPHSAYLIASIFPESPSSQHSPHRCHF